MASNQIIRLSKEQTDLLRSSIIITNLSDAISELIKNAIDARSSKIDVLLNLSTGSVTVSDDGTGISPADV